MMAMTRAYRQNGLSEVREVIDQLQGAPGASELFLLQRNGQKIAGNLPPMPSRPGTFELATGYRHALVLGIGTKLGPGVYAFSGSELRPVREVQAEILQSLLWMFVGSLLLAAAGGLLVSRSFLSRTDAMSRACRAIMDGNLGARLPVRGTRDELDRLASTVNEMLDRIAILMDNLGQVTNDIAHDLRTPVTHLRQRLENGRKECANPVKSEAAFDASIEKTDEILAMFAALLRIVQIEGGSRRASFAPLRLGALLQQLHQMFVPVSEATGHSLVLAATDDATISGDRALLIQLFSNLIENAIIHTPAGTNIWLRLSVASQQRATITIADDGPGVPHEENSKLFRRLYRREASRTTPGHGLGLALVAAIAELHGCIAEIEPIARGFSVKVGFETIAE